MIWSLLIVVVVVLAVAGWVLLQASVDQPESLPRSRPGAPDADGPEGPTAPQS